ncbi:phage head closure protein [Lysinibacillus pakistanensis]|uniref:phage head closure protein n=1 Tax=Lysinibacillus pakistanensis TaxID=759811 RepID=UPI003D2C5F29
MLYAEFPHEVEVVEKRTTADDSGDRKTQWIPIDTIESFVDTPTSKEKLLAHQVQNPLDRYMYYPYRTDLKSDMRLRYEGEIYAFAGRPEDQGGQHEIMRVALKLVID